MKHTEKEKEHTEEVAEQEQEEVEEIPEETSKKPRKEIVCTEEQLERKRASMTKARRLVIRKLLNTKKENEELEKRVKKEEKRTR